MASTAKAVDLGADQVKEAAVLRRFDCPSIGAQKLGQPVPLSNLVLEENNGKPHPAQRYVPGRYSLFSGLVQGRSVSRRRSTAYCSKVSSRRHSSSDLTISNLPGEAT